MRVKVAVLGATGFTGEKLVELLLNHPFIEISYLASRTEKPLPYKDIFPRFNRRVDIYCEPLDVKVALKKADFFFLALPHTVSMEIAPRLLEEGRKVIDLSADYRLKDNKIYEKYYGVKHNDIKNLKKAVYGLPEFFKEDIKKALIVANPGCYPTSVILAVAPLLKEKIIDRKIIVNSLSSISGAGRKPNVEHHFINVLNNIWTYKPFVHQHIPEIEQVLKDISGKTIELTFTPHVVGVESGIYSTIYVNFKSKISLDKLRSIYESYYSACPFIRLREPLPKLRDVIGTNFCDIGFALNSDGKEAVIVSSIDNLIKGAAGLAIQNMNIMEGFKETEGLML
ncbi:MAG: N-acetyl-gamma-glutamyl-phosphate reductase [Candidatus Omnitrophica bacterium]|nr:N-acetyl-gamma-glutamyl-phosphate reductase [Candidatus Omnitrophota bacterium]MCM8825997.1 N-acetyl-gamma-glutamyl-phosphate reductase [Candidatus Omnitrophota bacterium]